MNLFTSEDQFRIDTMTPEELIEEATKQWYVPYLLDFNNTLFRYIVDTYESKTGKIFKLGYIKPTASQS